MTAPAAQFVDERGWPVIDRLLVAAFTELVVVAGKTVRWGTTLTDDGTQPPEELFPAGRVMRLPGGGFDSNRIFDRSRIEVMTWGTTRPESDSMTAQVRQVMADLANGEYAGVGLDRITEDQGPGRIPDPREDLRAVPTTWVVVARQQ